MSGWLLHLATSVDSEDVAQVVIEVDGPSHFSVNSRRPLGRTVARKLMIEGRGYIVRSIPYYEWCALDGMETRQTYLWRLLASAVSLGNGQAAAQLESPPATGHGQLPAAQLAQPAISMALQHHQQQSIA